jgi:hypothetical protein
MEIANGIGFCKNKKVATVCKRLGDRDHETLNPLHICRKLERFCTGIGHKVGVFQTLHRIWRSRRPFGSHVGCRTTMSYQDGSKI